MWLPAPVPSCAALRGGPAWGPPSEVPSVTCPDPTPCSLSPGVVSGQPAHAACPVSGATAQPVRAARRSAGHGSDPTQSELPRAAFRGGSLFFPTCLIS